MVRSSLEEQCSTLLPSTLVTLGLILWAGPSELACPMDSGRVKRPLVLVSQTHSLHCILHDLLCHKPHSILISHAITRFIKRLFSHFCSPAVWSTRRSSEWSCGPRWLHPRIHCHLLLFLWVRSHRTNLTNLSAQWSVVWECPFLSGGDLQCTQRSSEWTIDSIWHTGTGHSHLRVPAWIHTARHECERVSSKWRVESSGAYLYW